MPPARQGRPYALAHAGHSFKRQRQQHTPCAFGASPCTASSAHTPLVVSSSQSMQHQQGQPHRQNALDERQRQQHQARADGDAHHARRHISGHKLFGGRIGASKGRTQLVGGAPRLERHGLRHAAEETSNRCDGAEVIRSVRMQASQTCQKAQHTGGRTAHISRRCNSSRPQLQQKQAAVAGGRCRHPPAVPHPSVGPRQLPRRATQCSE